MSKSNLTYKRSYIRLPDFMFDKLNNLAAQKGLSMNSLIVTALSEYFDKEAAAAATRSQFQDPLFVSELLKHSGVQDILRKSLDQLDQKK